MRVLLSTFGSRGDVQPLAGLALRLREKGAQVRVCAPPDREFADLLAGVGVPFVPGGEAVRPIVTGATKMAPQSLPERAAGIMSAHYERIIEAARDSDAVVATGLFPACAAARAAAEKAGARYALAAFAPTVLPSHHHPPYERPGRPHPPEITDNRELWDRNIEDMNALFGKAYNDLRSSIGLEPVDDVRGHVYTRRPWLAADPVLSPWPPTDFEVEQTGAWILPDERPLPADLEAFLEAGAPPVYVSFGSMPMQASRDAAQIAAEAARAHGRRVVLGSGWADLAFEDASSDGAEDRFVVGEVNQQALFPRMAAVVHHGGAGTTFTATRSGTPQVVVPQIVDQPYWAGRVADLGIGAAHEGPSFTVESMSAALERALAPETAARAEAVEGEVRTDGTTVAANLLFEAVG
ncbi:glycosyltransferase [Glycomyces sp. NRRL B-16210]|uniref:glycosyltransferase n=1 Tax=Glycomyces sp. NRRL B-16210 TaxID=1463821 RepID=UPI0004C0A8E1|nr:glycosyltransferase [Glycomyces sp. NRRL B-16210]